MDIVAIALVVLVIAAIWAVVELALSLRRARTALGNMEQAVQEISKTAEETRPVIARVDETLDALQPAIAQAEPLLQQGNVALEALCADLVEMNGVLRDVSQVTGSMSNASGAVSGIASAASEKVHQLFGKKSPETPATDRALEHAQESVESTQEAEDTPQQSDYYTYGSSQGTGSSGNEQEDLDD